MHPDSLDRLNTVFAGRYAIEKELGRGGMATVFLANDIRHRRKVAIKVLQPDLVSAVATERFQREIVIAAQLNHPHILALYDSGDIAGAPFYVMPYVRGESLRARLSREGSLPLEEALRIARQVASALDYAHACQLVHRDIKPENILLHEGEAMVADFGIALAPTSAAQARLTTMGIAVGSPHYMSPEQAAGESDIDARSDVFSLACVLFEMLAGSPPFTGRTLQAIIAKRFAPEMPTLHSVMASAPAAVDAAIAKAMSFAAVDRFATCGAFMEALNLPVTGARITQDKPSVAVLPFRSLSAEPDNDFFADGVTEDVIAQLTKIRSLKVISRTSVMRFKTRDAPLRDIGSMLGVATVLDGSVRRVGDRVRIVARLSDVARDEELWAETYDRQLTDIFAIQSDVALQIASALEAELSPDEQRRIRLEPTTSVQAYQLYLQGRFHYSRYTATGFVRAIEFYQEALKLDPTYALAHVGIAQAHIEHVVSGSAGVTPTEGYREAGRALGVALRIDPNCGQAHSILALLRFTHDFDWVGAELEFKRALELNPGDADLYDYYGWFCASVERNDEAVALVRRAQELDPLAHRSDVANHLIRAGRLPEAITAARSAVSFDPHYARARAALGWALFLSGQTDEGVRELEAAADGSPENTMFLAQLGEAYGMLHRHADARRVITQLEQQAATRTVSPYHFAYVYTGLGEYDRAMDMLEQAYDSRAGSLYGVKGSFLFTQLREHPRFQQLLSRMNLA